MLINAISAHNVRNYIEETTATVPSLFSASTSAARWHRAKASALLVPVSRCEFTARRAPAHGARNACSATAVGSYY